MSKFKGSYSSARTRGTHAESADATGVGASGVQPSLDQRTRAERLRDRRYNRAEIGASRGQHGIGAGRVSSALNILRRPTRSGRSLRSQIDELAAIEGVADDSANIPPAATPLELLPCVVDPLLGTGSGTVSVAICTEGTSLEPIPAEMLSGGATHEATIAPGRKVRNPHKPHVIRLPEQARRSAGHVPAKLRPVRDAGIDRLSRADRMRQRQRRRQLLSVVGAVVAVAVILGAGIYWKQYSDRIAAETDLTSIATTDSAMLTSATEAALGGAALTSLDASDTPTGEGALSICQEAEAAGVTPLTPTPIFASYGDLQLRLPVSVADLTEVGLHQANYTYTLQLDTHMPGMSVDDVAGVEGTKRDKSLQKSGDSELLVGSYIELWRTGRNTDQRTAADCGAAPGTVAYAPVSGVVTKVQTYQLEGKSTDYEIHIVPDGFPAIELVMIHIEGVVVREGDHVLAGATPIARVRDITGIVRSQLASYAAHGGNHAHIQLNDMGDPSYIARHAKN